MFAVSRLLLLLVITVAAGQPYQETYSVQPQVLNLTLFVTKVSKSKVVSSFFTDDIFYVVIVFKIHEVIYLRKGLYITEDIL
jgi:hypothetical protein